MQQKPSAIPSSAGKVLLGRYRVLEVNSEGGFGKVCICWDTRLRRRVAIKRMPLHVGSDSRVHTSTIFEAIQEARTSSMLAHPNIVTVYDFESDDLYSYLVMEYVDGLSLQDLLDRVDGGVLTFDECAHLVDSVASALSFAHENGVLHLDIKPANILINRSGTVKLGDFGMATLASAAGFGGARGGTIGYMPPEQINGDLVDERTDIFSLAVVVWQSLTGTCPFAASSPLESLDLIKRGPSPALSRIEPELAGIVEQTLLSALAANPKLRTPRLESFSKDLVHNLGDPQEGQDSLRELLDQTESKDEEVPPEEQRRLRVPLLVRIPWLPEFACRLLSAATASWICLQTIPFILPDSGNLSLFATLGIASACAIWPPLNGLICLCALIAALATQPGTLSMPLTLTIGCIGLIWWLVAGRISNLAGTALLLPSALSSPLAGVGLAGFALPAPEAFLTGVLSWLLAQVFLASLSATFSPDIVATSVRDTLLQPHSWFVATGCGLAALVCSLLTSRRSTLTSCLGQASAVLILFGTYVAYAQMEKASIAEALDGPSLGITVLLGVTLCIVSKLANEGD